MGGEFGYNHHHPCVAAPSGSSVMPHRKTLSDIIKPGKMISLPPEAPAALAARKMLEC